MLEHIFNDSDFALEEGLIPKNIAKGTTMKQFLILAESEGITSIQVETIFDKLLSNSDKVVELIEASYLSDSTKLNYLQTYQPRLKKLKRG